MRRLLLGACSFTTLVLAAAVAPGCGDENDSTFNDGSSGSSGGDGDGGCAGFGCTNQDGGKPGCVGLACNQHDCTGTTKTTVTGKVFDPAGKVPLYNVVVYVPNVNPAPITLGLGPACDRCDGTVSGSQIAITLTDATGSFKLENVPADVDFPIVMQIGKWRRQVVIPKVAPCQTAAVDAGITRLPRNRTEGDIPRIALTTGSANPLECLLRKVGLDDTEFGGKGSESRVHLYAGGSTDDGTPPGPDKATTSFKTGSAFPPATGLWANPAELKKYDIVLLSCEGGEHPETKAAPALQGLYDYANAGGRVFTSHYHHYWLSNSPVADVKGIASWTNDFTCTSGACQFVPEPAKDVKVAGTINEGFPKGQAMKAWLKNTDSLTESGDRLPLFEMRHNVNAVTPNKALSWITVNNPAQGAANKLAHEYVSFNTPVGAADDKVCGRVVYSDLHVGAGDTPGAAFPDECKTKDLTPQQKALEFMLFDLSSCIQKDDQAPSVPK